MPHSNSSTPLIAASCKMNASGNGSTRYNTLNALIFCLFYRTILIDEWQVLVTNGLLFVDSGNNTSSPTVIAKLAQINALPCAKIQSSVGDRNGEADSKQRTFGMRRHIVGTF